LKKKRIKKLFGV